MKRLTMRNRDGTVSQPFDLRWADALTRLAAYEDTGLEPEDVKELCTGEVYEVAKMLRQLIESGEIERLQELLDAERNGRLVVLPDVDERSRKAFTDGLHDYFKEADFSDPSVGIFGMSYGESKLAEALMAALTQDEAETTHNESVVL